MSVHSSAASQVLSSQQQSPTEQRRRHHLWHLRTTHAQPAEAVVSVETPHIESPPAPPPVQDPDLPRYYQDLETPSLLTKFQNLDTQEVFLDTYTTLQTEDTRNFVVDFGPKDAWVATNVGLQDAGEMRALLGPKRPSNLHSRWINLWAPHLQTEVVEALAFKYRLSPRLKNLICSAPTQNKPPPLKEPPTEKQSMITRGLARLANIEQESTSDVEKMAYALPSEVSVASKIDKVNHFRIVSDVWHFMSVDYGHQYACIGYNTLHNVVNVSSEKEVDAAMRKDTPEGKRVWCWLILCSDDTVISIYEDPFADLPHLGPSDVQQMRRVRKNLLNVFQELSKAEGAAKNTNPIMTLHLRRHQMNSIVSLSQPSTEDPSLVLYYLFDDWYNSFNMLVGRNNIYRAALEKVRESVSLAPDPNHIGILHHTGRQLQTLKRLYVSYLAIVDRVLENHKRKSKPHEVLVDRIMHVGSDLRSEMNSDLSEDQPTEVARITRGFGPALAPEAIARFERLRDRIELYAIKEIESCLEEKDSLVFMTFNMIALKESHAVEKLTRGTILLTKVTIVFLPLSLQTAYFSIQVGDIQNIYSLKTYWVSFLVISILSILGLMIYGVMTNTLEGKVVYRSLYKTMTAAFRDKRKHKKQS